jgi:hypothetical protein
VLIPSAALHSNVCCAKRDDMYNEGLTTIEWKIRKSHSIMRESLKFRSANEGIYSYTPSANIHLHCRCENVSDTNPNPHSKRAKIRLIRATRASDRFAISNKEPEKHCFHLVDQGIHIALCHRYSQDYHMPSLLRFANFST